MKKILALLFASAFSLHGCGHGAANSDDSDVSLAKNSMALASQTAGLAVIAGDPLAQGVKDDADAASKAAAAFPSYFQNGSCASAAVDPSNTSRVVVTLNKCNGAHGLVNVSGQLVFDYVLQGNSVTIRLSPMGPLMIDGNEFIAGAQVTIGDLTKPRSVSVQTSSSLNDANGNLLLSHSGGFMLAWDTSRCVSLDGQLTASIIGEQLATGFTGFHRCPSQCPQGAFELTVGDPSNADTVQAEFDGSHLAKLVVQTPSSMHTVPFPILCP